jgi:hypothetical protein
VKINGATFFSLKLFPLIAFGASEASKIDCSKFFSKNILPQKLLSWGLLRAL